jgi:pilus assembly protein CpaC
MSQGRKAIKLMGIVGLVIPLGLLSLETSGAGARQQASSAPRAQQVPAAIPPATPPAQAELPQSSEAPQDLHLLVGRSLVITSPTRIKRVSIADPVIADAIVVSPNQVLVNGKAAGGVSLLVWDEADQSQAFEVSVDIDVLSLTQKIHEVFPTERVQVETSKDVVMLSGRISSSAVADKILEVVKNATPKVTSLMEVPTAPPGEILLEVKFAEVDRTALQQLGINILSLPGAKNLGSITTEQFSPPIIQGQVGSVGGGGSTSTSSTATFGLSSLLNILIIRPDIDLAATIQALQNNNVLQILAEPNLLTESGKEASFLAGGEFPFPVVQGLGTGTFAAITIQFKEFGVRLNFTPTLTAEGLVHLKVKPEVSSLDFANGLSIQGFLVPALSTRRVESEMELRDGQSFAIAGLVDNRVTKQFSKIPGIGDIPVLGKLFQSRTLNKTNDELLVLVTPRIVRPLEKESNTPLPVMPIPFLKPLGPEQQKAPGSN